MRHHRMLIMATASWALLACPEPSGVSVDTKDAEHTADAPLDVSPDTDAGSVTPNLAEALVEGQVRAGIVRSRDELIAGPKAEGQLGDLKLYNAHVAFIVEGARVAGGWREQGGHVVDAAPTGYEDRYGELFPVWNLHIFYPDSVEVVSDGRDGEAHVRVHGSTGPFDLAIGFLDALLAAPVPTLDVTIDYRLGPDDWAVRASTTLTNRGQDMVPIDALLMSAHGDGAPVYSTAGAGWDSDAAGGGPVRYFGAVGARLAYGYAAVGDPLQLLFSPVSIAILQRDSFSLEVGGSWVQEALVAVSTKSANGLDQWWRETFNDVGATGRVRGTVNLPEGCEAAEAYLVVWDDDRVVTVASVADDGAFEVEASPGDYVLEAFARGHLASEKVATQIEANAVTGTTLQIPQAAEVTVFVTDEAQSPLAARVSFVRQGETADPTPPRAARLYGTWGGGISTVAYANRAPASVRVPAGSYRVVASRGLSYELDSKQVTIDGGTDLSLDFALSRAVDTSGWTATDLHIHAMHSPDSSVPYETRALQAATDDLDLPLITEHLATGSLAQTSAEVGVDDLLIAIAATEITSLSWGHFIAFPTPFEPTAVNRGALYPLDKQPPDIFAAERAGPQETIITVAHPRSSFGPFAYFDVVGLDTADMSVATPSLWSLDFDTIEVFNGGCGTEGENGTALADWKAMTSQGVLKTLVSGSDTHDEGQPGGVPRTWVEVDRSLALEDSQRVVMALKERRAVVSCGPFVRFESTDGARVGGLAGVDEQGRARFQVTVEAPSWIHVDRVHLLENGAIAQTFVIGEQAGPVVRFDDTLSVQPAADAWYAIEVVGTGSLEPVHSSGPPYALTNAIRVDADGDGAWTPPGLVPQTP